jgi:hypothetical protein
MYADDVFDALQDLLARAAAVRAGLALTATPAAPQVALQAGPQCQVRETHVLEQCSSMGMIVQLLVLVATACAYYCTTAFHSLTNNCPARPCCCLHL